MLTGITIALISKVYYSRKNRINNNIANNSSLQERAPVARPNPNKLPNLNNNLKIKKPQLAKKESIDIAQKLENDNTKIKKKQPLQIKQPPLPKGEPPDIEQKTQSLQINNLEVQPKEQIKNMQKSNLKDKIQRIKNINKLIKKPKLLLLEEDDNDKNKSITK